MQLLSVAVDISIRLFLMGNPPVFRPKPTFELDKVL
jgi:hypothetical protein